MNALSFALVLVVGLSTASASFAAKKASRVASNCNSRLHELDSTIGNPDATRGAFLEPSVTRDASTKPASSRRSRGFDNAVDGGSRHEASARGGFFGGDDRGDGARAFDLLH